MEIFVVNREPHPVNLVHVPIYDIIIGLFFQVVLVLLYFINDFLSQYVIIDLHILTAVTMNLKFVVLIVTYLRH